MRHRWLAVPHIHSPLLEQESLWPLSGYIAAQDGGFVCRPLLQLVCLSSGLCVCVCVSMSGSDVSVSGILPFGDPTFPCPPAAQDVGMAVNHSGPCGGGYHPRDCTTARKPEPGPLPTAQGTAVWGLGHTQSNSHPNLHLGSWGELGGIGHAPKGVTP